MLARPPHQGETSATLGDVGSRHISPSPPEHRMMGRIRSRPPPRAITKRRTRCQSDGRDPPSHEERAPQLTRTASHNINTALLQCAPNLFNLLLIHASNTNTTVDITITVLNNFELKRDTIQAKNYLPAQ